MLLTIYGSSDVGNTNNCYYPEKIEIENADMLKAAVRVDHVCCAYMNNHRKNDNFICSDCVVMDVDNDHSNNPCDWVTPETLKEEYEGIQYAITYSRHHMKQKGRLGPRPRFHVYFAITPTDDSKQYKALKVAIQAKYPFYDKNALDVSRFIFGCVSEDVIWHDGEQTIADLIDAGHITCNSERNVIPEGERNNTLFQQALHLMKEYGDTTESKKRYIEFADRCEPRLPAHEVDSIWRSAAKYVDKKSQPKEDWEDPIPFSKYAKIPFPIDALPPSLAEYVAAVAETTQTPVDMAGTAAIVILSVCLQGKYAVEGKEGWIEPTNLYANIIALPSERKSSVLRYMIKPIDYYEQQYNKTHAADFELSKTKRKLLEHKRKSLEEQVSTGKADLSQLEAVIREMTSFVEEKPLQLYVDDTTTEKLVSVLARNDGRAAIISAEGGIFDTLAGIYTKNVNIDVMLKGYSGDTIRVDRISRDSESIMRPVLSVLLMTQPYVVSKLLKNELFRGRGLTARFLYSFPDSLVGERRFETRAIASTVSQRYYDTLLDLLNEEYPTSPTIFTISAEAKELLSAFFLEIEPRLADELRGIADWAGKLLGNILRIAALLYRVRICERKSGNACANDLQIDRQTMVDAIRLGRYYLSHAQAVFKASPEDEITRKATMILEMIKDQQLHFLTRRDVQRKCRSFKTATEVQEALDYLEETGYLRKLPPKDAGSGNQQKRYEVSPLL